MTPCCQICDRDNPELRVTTADAPVGVGGWELCRSCVALLHVIRNHFDWPLADSDTAEQEAEK